MMLQGSNSFIVLLTLAWALQHAAPNIDSDVRDTATATFNSLFLFCQILVNAEYVH